MTAEQASFVLPHQLTAESTTQQPPQFFAPAQQQQRQQLHESCQGGEPQHVDDDEEEEEQILVSCRCESAKAVATLLNCLRHVGVGSGGGGDGILAAPSQGGTSSGGTRRGSTGHAAMQPVTVFCTPSHLTFHLYGRAKQMQASVDLQASLFSHYHVLLLSHKDDCGNNDASDNNNNDERNDWQAGGEFCVNLSKVMECLQVLGGSFSANNSALERTQLTFSYNATTEIFRMELLEADSGILITAAIPGMIPPQDEFIDDDHNVDDDRLRQHSSSSLAFAFRSSPVASRMIVQSDALQEMMPELELVSGATHVTLSLTHRGLEFAAVGHLGECVVSIPSKGPHVVSLESASVSDGASQTIIPRTYPLHSLLASMRGLDIAQETCITINTAGMMAIQHQIVDSCLGGDPSFVDFILCCLDDEEEGNDNDESVSRTRTQASQSQMSSSSPGGATLTYASQATTRSRGMSQRHNDDEGSSSDDDSQPSHSLPLFGSLVTGGPSASPLSSHQSAYDRSPSTLATSPDPRWNGSHLSKRRRQQGGTRDFSSASRRRQDDTKSRRDGNDNVDRDYDDEDDNHSTNLLDAENNDLSTDQEDEGDGEDEEMADVAHEESQPLDVTVVNVDVPGNKSHRHHRDDDCSSPELVYGRQHF